MKVAVLGAGTMGAGIAFAAVVAGLKASLFDSSEAALQAGVVGIDRDLVAAEERGKIDRIGKEAARSSLDATGQLREAVVDADVVIEAVTEDIAVKSALLREVEGFVGDDAILATNTSALSVTSLAGGLRRPERCVGMHFFNPVRAMKLCEIVVALPTNEATVRAAEDVAKAMGKQTVRVRDGAGFVTSRINAIIGNEAFFLLEEGVATAEDIDKAVKLALNHPMGPLELADLVGLDVRLAVLQELRRSFGDKYRPAPLMERYVRAGWLGRKTGRGVYRYDTDYS